MTDQPLPEGIGPQNIVLVDARRLMCASHGEHLREHWPKGAAIVMTRITKAALEGEALMRAVDPAWDGKAGTADFAPERVNEVTSRRPFCYFVSRATIRDALLAAGILRKVRCQVCNRKRQGGPYQISTPSGVVTRQVCIDCALDAGDREHEARPDGFPMERR